MGLSRAHALPPGCVSHRLPATQLRGWPHDITVPTTCDCPRQDAGGPGHFPAFLWVTVAAHRGAPADAVHSLLEVLTLHVMAPSFIALGSTLGAESALLAVC